MGIEREVVGDEAQVCAKERLEPAAQTAVDDERLVTPEETVVDEHELRARLGRPLEQLQRGGDATRDLVDVRRADDLQPGTAEFGKPVDLQPFVRVGDDLVPAGHGRILGRVARARETDTLFRLGVWRSLVARSVRVGEVPSSNLGTPIERGGAHGSPTNPPSKALHHAD